MARAASAKSPAMRTIMPQRVERSTQTITGANSAPTMNSALILSASRTAAMSLHQPSWSAGSVGACGWMSGLPR